jgi:hypothetical protein
MTSKPRSRMALESSEPAPTSTLAPKNRFNVGG